MKPLVLVDPPVTTPYRYGLFSVTQIVDAPDLREFAAGVTWPRQATPAASAAVNATALCDPGEATEPLGGDGDVEVAPVRLDVAWRCRTVGVDDHEARARAAFARVEQVAVEWAAWSGHRGSRPRLNNPATPVLANGPVSLEVGVGLLEAWAASAIGVASVIWVPRFLSGPLAARSLLSSEGPRRLAPAGTPLALVTSDGSGPGGVPPGEGRAWLYVTGPVLIRRSAVTVHGGIPSGLDTASNELTVRVRRQYLTGWDRAAAVQVTAPTT